MSGACPRTYWTYRLIDILGLFGIGGEVEGAGYQAVADAGAGFDDLFFRGVAELTA